MTLQLPTDKKEKIKHFIKMFLNKNKCNLHDFTRLNGLLVSACPALDYSWLYTKKIEALKYLYLSKNPNYNQTIYLSEEIKEDLIWWLNNIDTGYSKIKSNLFVLEIFSDASLTGWGAYCNGEESHGLWTTDEMNLHINELELKAALFGLKIFTKKLTQCEILLRIDNTTAISCINRMGSVQYPHLHKVARALWEWCESRNLYVFASYINTKNNEKADSLSRRRFSDTEWELGDYAFHEIKHCFGEFDIDLFASRANAKCPIYVTWQREPDAWAIDAFTISWKNVYFYAFPPFALILKTLNKIIIDKAEGVLVVPYWQTQPWFPLFRKLACNSFITFLPDIKLLKSPSRLPHPLHRSLRLVAAKLSGKNT